MSRSASEILKAPYSRVIIPDEVSGYTGLVREFEGCVAEGDTPEETYKNLESAAAGWIEAALERGQEIPRPLVAQEYSGRVLLRLPKSVHREVAAAAEADGTSINQFILAAVAERLGRGRTSSTEIVVVDVQHGSSERGVSRQSLIVVH